jgi:hypothetical protein
MTPRWDSSVSYRRTCHPAFPEVFLRMSIIERRKVSYETIEHYDFAAAATANRARKYPWDEWQRGAIIRVRPGVDFTCEPESFRRALNDRAQRDGLRAESHVEDNGCVVFRFLLT